MAATEQERGSGRALSPTLQALTTAALLLPGLQSAQAQQGDDSTSLQFSRFTEGRRHTAIDTRLEPLQAYTLDFRTARALSDDTLLRLGLTQDAWSGATPVTVAPAVFGGNRPVLVTTQGRTSSSGASPLVTGSLPVDAALQPLRSTANGALLRDAGSELIMSSASPEVRRQIELGLDLRDQGRTHTLAAGYSGEPDFHSWHTDWQSRLDFNKQQSTLAFGASYTHSDIAATLDPLLLPYLVTDADDPAYHRSGSVAQVRGVRTDRSLSLGLTQVLDHDSLLDIGANWTYSNGLLEQPYKTMSVLFAAPEAVQAGLSPITADLRALMERRPDSRTQGSLTARYIRHIAATDAALHVSYGYSSDDWGIDSHSIELQWLQPLGRWLLAPRLRWYSQDAASFHAPWLATPQRFRSIARDTQGRELWHDTVTPSLHYVRTADGTLLDASGKVLDPALVSAAPDFRTFSRALLPANFSSDPRLGGFGVVSGGIGMQYAFGNGLRLDAGLDYYRRASSLRVGGNGDTPYADYDYLSVSLALNYDWNARRTATHTQHVHTMETNGSDAALVVPAGLQLLHPAMPAGSMMAGYQLQLHNPGMAMHMLDFSHALTDHWTLTAMPQFMTSRHQHTSDSVLHQHAGVRESGAPETLLLASSWQAPSPLAGGQWQLTTGLGVPVTGSGEWSAQPALAWWQTHDGWQWGAQWRLLHAFATPPATAHDAAAQHDTSLWLAAALGHSLWGTVRGLYSDGRDATGPFHASALGFGVQATLLGQPLRLEWLQALHSTIVSTGREPGGTFVIEWHTTL